MKLRGKVAIITGAASGMGLATAVLFGKEGAKVTVADIQEKSGEETVRLIENSGGEGIFMNIDVSRPGD